MVTFTPFSSVSSETVAFEAPVEADTLAAVSARIREAAVQV